MKIFLALLALHCGFVPDFDKKDVDPIIQLLGDNDFETRENTEEKLITMNVPILYLESKYSKEPNPEIRARLTRVILHKTYYKYSDGIPQIWQMNPNIRYPFGHTQKQIVISEYQKYLTTIFGCLVYETVQMWGEVTVSYYDLSKIYYDEAAAQIGNIEDYQNPIAARLATTILIKDLIRSGMYNKDECKKLLEDMSRYTIKYNRSGGNSANYPLPPAYLKETPTPDPDDPDKS